MKRNKIPAEGKQRRKGRKALLWIGCGAAALLLILLAVYMTGAVGRTVGETVKLKDVTDFYYTYSTSTNPPYFQRYRFYLEESGTPVFYHEKREGDHWPLREGDVTVSGTKELTGEQWAAFFDCLRGGTVRKRQESAEAGGRGPWMYLYWRGDHGKIQEFTFPSPEARRAFEDMCLALMEE